MDKVIGRHFALVWVSLLALLVFFSILYFFSDSNPFYSNVVLILVGGLVGLIGGKAS